VRVVVDMQGEKDLSGFFTKKTTDAQTPMHSTIPICNPLKTLDRYVGDFDCKIRHPPCILGS
jgi:hypothetical protein